MVDILGESRQNGRSRPAMDHNSSSTACIGSYALVHELTGLAATVLTRLCVGTVSTRLVWT